MGSIKLCADFEKRSVSRVLDQRQSYGIELAVSLKLPQKLAAIEVV